MSPFHRVAIGVVVVASLASCSSTKNEADSARARVGGLVAQLRAPTSPVNGTVRVYDYRDGVQVQITAQNLIPGQYRVAFHATGNCSSPNLFSAGPAWAPPDSPKPAADLLPGFLTGADGSHNSYVAYVPGVHTDREPSVQGRSIVIHWGSRIDEAFPGQPNNRVACGVLQWYESAL